MGFRHQTHRHSHHPPYRGAAELTPPLFIGSEVYRGSSYGGAHPLRVPRVSTVIDLARALDWLPTTQYRTSPRAKPAALMLWHTAEYIAALMRAEATQAVIPADTARHGLGTLSNPVFPDMFRRPATGAGGVMLAAQLLGQAPGVIHVPGGGTHHGMPDRANGFCYLNDPVLALLSLRRAGLQRLAYIDIDAHHPDGVEHGLSADPDILQISVHEEQRWPFTGALTGAGLGQVYNLPVPRGFNDTEMQAVLDDLILPQVQSFAPQAIVLQCGADALDEDPLSRLSLSNNAHWAVVAALQKMTDRFLVLGGGGYHPWSVGRCWTGVWATLNGHQIPEHLPHSAEAVLRNLSWNGSKRARPADAMFTTLRDPPRAGIVRAEVTDRIWYLNHR
jgi:acetoin utilization protein AcuC